MESPPKGPKPRSALPSYLTNGSGSNSPLHVSSHTKEREKLFASINASTTKRQAVDLNEQDATKQGAEPSTSSSNGHIQDGYNPSTGQLTAGARDARDEPPASTPPAIGRPASPYTLNAPIDFDGLSWPSRLLPSRSDYRAPLTLTDIKVWELERGSRLLLSNLKNDYKNWQER
jgi:GTP cyclohydrolase I